MTWKSIDIRYIAGKRVHCTGEDWRMCTCVRSLWHRTLCTESECLKSCLICRRRSRRRSKWQPKIRWHVVPSTIGGLQVLPKAAEQQLHLKGMSVAELCRNDQVKKMILDDMTKLGKDAGLHSFEQVNALQDQLWAPAYWGSRFSAPLEFFYSVLRSQTEMDIMRRNFCPELEGEFGARNTSGGLKRAEL